MKTFKEIALNEAKDSGSGFKNEFSLGYSDAKSVAKGYGSKWEKQGSLELMYDGKEHVMTYNKKEGMLYTDFDIKQIEDMMKGRQATNEAEEDTFYSVILLGGSIGEKTIRSISQMKGEKFIALDDSNKFSDIADAKAKAKRMNKLLSPGERKYYGLKYAVAAMVNDIYTGKGK